VRGARRKTFVDKTEKDVERPKKGEAVDPGGHRGGGQSNHGGTSLRYEKIEKERQFGGETQSFAKKKKGKKPQGKR